MKIAIRSLQNSRYLSAEYGGGVDLPAIAITANRIEPKGFETFEETKLPDGRFTLKTFTGHYVTVDINGYLRTNGFNNGDWEKLRWNSNYIETIHGTRLTNRIDKEYCPIETTINEGTWEDFERIPLEAEIPIGNPELDEFPRIGTSIASIFMNNSYDYKRFAQQLEDNKMTLTGINCLSAQWPDMAHSRGTWPWILPELEGQSWDLLKFNQEYLDKLYDVINTFHSHNVHVILVLKELYSWSNRKRSKTQPPGPDDVPNANMGPWRNNINGVRWGGRYNGDRKEDDETLAKCPDFALRAFLDFMAPVFKINGGLSVKIGNEYPEKELHYRIRNYIRQFNPNVRFIVNRNEDTSGQYQNMKIGQEFKMIDYHGWKNLGFLNRIFDSPPEYPSTFKQFFDKKSSSGKPINVDFKNCIVNSDGARNGSEMPPNTYIWDDLYKVHKFCYEKGCSIDHQSQVKMTGNLDDLETEYLRKLADLAN